MRKDLLLLIAFVYHGQALSHDLERGGEAARGSSEDDE